MKNIKFIEILDKKRVRITFNNNHAVILEAQPEDFGYDAAIYISDSENNK